ncbi:hypothetical protein NHX12_015719 [Muraenolepis orangiensis]|uniref:Target of rapamycin complex subunit lst8 n=1 Tax=Muraenolepis orangiensis TaxID=630683 RepID=A0A9Q0DBT4_9TELE|nr:hypothetical protein NHX12_015719 [Muraenolepis orangiensis]
MLRSKTFFSKLTTCLTLSKFALHSYDGYQHIRMYDLNSNNPNPVITYDGVSKNITSVGFHEDGRWMYTGGEDCMARIWDLRSRNLQCQRIFQVNAPINCVCLHPNQAELIVGDQSGVIHIWDLKTDHNEQLIPQADVSINSVHIDPDASYMAAVNNSGNCYVWNLAGGMGDEVTQLIPKTKIPAHKRYSLRCKFSPDSTLLISEACLDVLECKYSQVLLCTDMSTADRLHPLLHLPGKDPRDFHSLGDIVINGPGLHGRVLNILAAVRSVGYFGGHEAEVKQHMELHPEGRGGAPPTPGLFNYYYFSLWICLR